VRRGDSLWQIANRYNVTVSQIARWNGLRTSSTLRPGARLTLEI
jgi:membrane-bound lytic murein transglycosylase D